MVDTTLQGKKSAAVSEQIVNTVCAHNCGGRARLACTVRNGVLVRVQPAPAPDDAYTGLCVRCLTLPQWVYSKERIASPLRRNGDQRATLRRALEQAGFTR